MKESRLEKNNYKYFSEVSYPVHLTQPVVRLIAPNTNDGILSEEWVERSNTRGKWTMRVPAEVTQVRNSQGWLQEDLFVEISGLG